MIGDTFHDVTKTTSKNLKLLFERCKEKSNKLNRDKVALRVQQIDFMGHRLTSQGLKPGPSKVEAILKLENPKTKEDIERLNGTVNFYQDYPKPLNHLGDSLKKELSGTGVTTKKGHSTSWNS